MMNDEILFSEQQRFTQWWLWAILISVNGMMIYYGYEQIFLQKQVGTEPAGSTGLLIGIGVTLTVTVLIFFLRLDTRITKEGIDVRLYPLHATTRHYSWDNIDKALVRKYSPIKEYGGWGIRQGGFGAGKAYNISGNQGIQLVFSNGGKLLIGTAHPQEVARILAGVELAKPDLF